MNTYVCIFLMNSFHFLVQDKFLLVDFNPYCPMTDSLLFSWEELTSDEFLSQTNDVTLNNYHPVFRLVDNVRIQPSDLQSLKLPLVQ